MNSNAQMRWESKVIEEMPESFLTFPSNDGYVSQVPDVGMILAKRKESNYGRQVTWKFKKISNFTINNLEVIDFEDGAQIIKFNAETNDGLMVIVEGSPNMFNSPKSFRNALNSMRHIFWGNTNDLQKLKMHLAKTLK